MKKNEYMLFNGPAVEISQTRFKEMIAKTMFKIPSFEKILRFDNDARFLADVTCVHKTNEFGIVTVNYGNIFDVLNNLYITSICIHPRHIQIKSGIAVWAITVLFAIVSFR